MFNWELHFGVFLLINDEFLLFKCVDCAAL